MLGVVLWQQGKLEEAEVLCRKALEGRETLLGPLHPDTLQSVNNLCSVAGEPGQARRSRSRFQRRALGGWETQLGAHHPETLRAVNNLAVLLQKQGKLEEAEGSSQKSAGSP